MSTIIKVVSFDLDNTLWENDSVIRRAEKIGYQWLVDNVPELTNQYSLADLIQLRLELLEKHPELLAQIGQLRKLSLQQVLKSIHFPEDLLEQTAENAFLAMYHERCKVTPYPETVPMLESLGDNYRLASLTNGNSSLEAINLDHHFDLSLSAEDVDSRKPEPEMFEALLAHFNCDPKQVIHIGDHPLDDVQGAQQVGIHAIWFNPEKKSWSDVSSNTEPAETVHCLSAISSAIDRIQSS